MTYEEVALSLQLLAEERVGSTIRANDREDEARFQKSIDELRRDSQLEKL